MTSPLVVPATKAATDTVTEEVPVQPAASATVTVNVVSVLIAPVDGFWEVLITVDPSDHE